MVNPTTSFRQASIRRIPALLLLLLLQNGCQTTRKTPLSQPAAAGKQTVAFLAPGRKHPAPADSIPAPIPLDPVDLPEAAPRETTPLLRTRPVELPAEIGPWRITRLSNATWRATPSPRQNLRDAPTSLMEDAIITSSIHARLQSVPALSATTWKYSCNSGNVLLSSANLTTAQAVAALQAVFAIEKVSRIDLTTTLHP